MHFPKEIKAIIMDYKNGLEHSEKWMCVMDEVQGHYFTMKRVRLNRHFHSIFFPGWYTDLILQPFPHIVIPLLPEPQEPSDLDL